MSGLTTPVGESDVLYLTVAGGNMVQKAKKGDPGAKERTFQDDDGNTITKYDIVHGSLRGLITGLDFKEGKFGEEFHISIQNGDAKGMLQLKVASDYFMDFAQRLPNLDLDKEVVLNPYEIEDDKGGRSKRGVSIRQEGEKVGNAYWNGKKHLNGIPSVPKEESKDYDSDDWKVHFIQVRKFLKKKVQAVVVPTHEHKPSSLTNSDDAEPAKPKKKGEKKEPVASNEGGDGLPF